MDMEKPNQYQTQGDNAEGKSNSPPVPSASGPNTATPSADPKTDQPGAPHRPRRPQRSPRVEGSVDISEPKTEAPPITNQDEKKTESTASPSEQTVPVAKPKGELTGPSIKARPKGPGHPPIRTVSVPQPPSRKPEPHHLTNHSQRAFSVAGTADTKAHNVEDFRLHMITWNVGSATPPDDLTSLLGLNVGDGNTDMYIIGLQEVNSMINKRLKDVLFTDQWSEAFMERLSPFGYVLVTSQRMQGLLLLIFAKYFHLPFLRGIQTETTRTGLGGYWGNKGGVSARMSVFGHSICFLNCHLPAHVENSEQRMEDFESILNQQQFEGQAGMGVLDHDLVFWFGDLNFRIDNMEMQLLKSAIDNNKFSILWDNDQLNIAKDIEPLLDGFQEGPLKFPPTYKYDIGTNTYDTSGKKRKPAWTDRILWRLRANTASAVKHDPSLGLTSATKITQHFYRCHMEYTVSDHKPVSSIFTLQYKLDLPLVTLMVADEWTSIAEATASFKVAHNYSRSSWDWIGLYKVGFKHHKDYVGYVWAKQEESDFHRQEHQVIFTEEELPRETGDFLLGYYSNNMSSIVGITEPFQIQLVTSYRVSSSDSSDFSSEDDSTVVMKINSQSSSPKKSKRRRRGRSGRSGSRSRVRSNSHSRSCSRSHSSSRSGSTSRRGSRSGSPTQLKLKELSISGKPKTNRQPPECPEEGSSRDAESSNIDAASKSAGSSGV